MPNMLQKTILPMRIICLAILLCLVSSCNQRSQPEDIDYGVARYVDPFIGTGGHGHVYPGATVPFGSVQLSPDNGSEGWDWSSGYHYSDSVIVGFSHTHLSGTGIGDLCDILVMPAIGKVDLGQKVGGIRESSFASTFSHYNEDARVGYYAVSLDNGIKVELTASQRVGFHKYSFPSGEKRQMVVDLGYHINWDKPLSTSLSMDSTFVLTGSRLSTGWAQDQRVYFAMSFSEQPKEVAVYDSTAALGALPQEGQRIRTQMSFGKGNIPIFLKIAISSAGIDGAMKALEEVNSLDFGEAKRTAANQWINELSKIDVSTQDQTLLRTFYTALYHTYLAPVVFDDALGQYKSPDGTIATADDYTRYDIFSLWDTFRAAHPLLTITQPDRHIDMIKSLIAHYQEYGLLPVWSLLGNETSIMTGYPAIPIITDAILKGYRDFDIELAYKAMRESAMQDINGTAAYRKFGYVPYEEIGESVTRTIEYAYDDWCIAQFAEELDKQDDYDYFLKRSEYWRNVYDESSTFMRPKLANGEFIKDFIPKEYSAYFCESNAWQYFWSVPHNIKGLIETTGGKNRFEEKLDSMFTLNPLPTDKLPIFSTGMIGQYAHGNEPSHHVAYLYNFIDKPHKTQKMIRQILESQYQNAPDGHCGNEDCGQMSSWYIFSALGFYPVNPAEGVYSFGSPIIKSATLNLENGKTFEIEVLNNSKENMYIQSVILNDKLVNKTTLNHSDIIKGGKLVIKMGASPATN